MQLLLQYNVISRKQVWQKYINVCSCRPFHTSTWQRFILLQKHDYHIEKVSYPFS